MSDISLLCHRPVKEARWKGGSGECWRWEWGGMDGGWGGEGGERGQINLEEAEGWGGFGIYARLYVGLLFDLCLVFRS